MTEQDWTALRDGPKHPRREDGMFLYVREVRSWGKTSRSFVAAPSLKDANSMFGWSRNTYESIRLHRASVAEVAAFPAYAIPEVVR